MKIHMPLYTFKRQDGHHFLKKLSFSDFKAVQDGDKVLLDENDQECELIFNPGELGFVLKDGESGGWPSKAAKENKYRQKRSKVMAKREKDHVFKSRLVPNYGGREAHNWKDVRDHVRSEKGVAAASTYDRLVAQEVSTS